MDKGREADLQQLREQMAHTRDPKKRAELNNIANKIANESGAVRSMRERLIKEHRNGNMDNIRDIHEYIKGKQQYAD